MSFRTPLSLATKSPKQLSNDTQTVAVNIKTKFEEIKVDRMEFEVEEKLPQSLQSLESQNGYANITCSILKAT